MGAAAGVASSDASLRSALVEQLAGGPGALMHELSLPVEQRRADVARVLPTRLVGYEIKSDSDRLDRLGAQAGAYEQVFALCHVVVGRRHLPQVLASLPDWWGVITTTRNGGRLHTHRRARPHGGVRPDVLVRLLWRAEAAGHLARAGSSPTRTASRAEIWSALVGALGPAALERAVAGSLLRRDPGDARIATAWSGAGGSGPPATF